jgi:hypothetical protein
MSTCESRPRAASCLLATTLLLGLGVALVSPPARAQSAEDQATARALFNEGRQLMRAGSYDRACSKLEAASKLYPGSGVLLNLGDCYEHVGRTASAWTEFAEAASAAERESRADDLAEAKRRQTALEPKLSRLAVRVPRETPGIVVKRDGTALDRAAWGTPIPVDPGTHGVTAEAPGHVAWSGSVLVAEHTDTASIDVPELAPMPVAQAAPPIATPGAPAVTTGDSAPAGDYWTARRVASASLTGLGLVGMGIGGAMVIVAKSKDDTARGESSPQRSTDSANAVSLGNAATVVTSLGAGIAACGLLFWLTAPGASVHVGTNGSGVLVSGRF